MKEETIVDKLFIEHIRNHFKDEHPDWEVVCKICGKTAKEIVGERVEVLKKSDVEKEIEDINNPDYECKCGFKGKVNKFVYDEDSHEILCPKCECDIDYKEIDFEKELKKRLIE
jgi:proteasome lid subunit RPN8/RPN11